MVYLENAKSLAHGSLEHKRRHQGYMSVAGCVMQYKYLMALGFVTSTHHSALVFLQREVA